MQLSDLISAVNNDLRYAPGATAHRNDVIAKLNEAYLELVLSKPWQFRLREHVATAYPDTTLDVTLTAGSQVVTAAANAVGRGWVGQQMVIEYAAIGGTMLTFRIVQLRSTTEFAIYPAWVGTTDTYEVTLRYVHGTPAPVRASEIVAAAFVPALGTVFPPSDRPIPLLPMTRLEHAAVDPMEAGTPRLWTLVGMASGGRPGAVGLGTSAPTAALGGSGPLDRVETRPPTSTFTAPVTVGGTLTASNTFRYFYTYFYEEKWSPPSAIVSATTTALNRTITLTGLEVEAAGVLGRTKHVFRDSGSGVFYYIAEVAEATSTLADDGSLTEDRDQRWDESMYAPSQHVGLYPRAEETVELKLLYLERPFRMVADTDAPSLPLECHPLLVHKVVEQIGARYGATEVVKQARLNAAAILGLMQRRYLDVPGPRSRAPWNPWCGHPGMKPTVSIS